MGHTRPKTRSEELKVEKACKHSSGCSFDPNILEIDQDGRFDDFLVKFDNGSPRVKN
jgi:hypothetical protein